MFATVGESAMVQAPIPNESSPANAIRQAVALTVTSYAVALEVLPCVAVRSPMSSVPAAITDGRIAVQSSMNRGAHNSQVAPAVVELVAIAVVNMATGR